MCSKCGQEFQVLHGPELSSLLCPSVCNGNFHLNRNFTELSFACFCHDFSQDLCLIICDPLRNFENDFVMHRSDDLSSGICQSLWEQAQCFLCDVCGCPLNGRVVECVLKPPKTGLICELLACSIGKSYCFASLGIVSEVSGPESDPKCGWDAQRTM